jgi:cyanophycin synthetase
MTCTDGIYIHNELVVKGDCSGPRSAQTVLLHPQVEVAVLETARGGILREGLAFDACTVGVVTNISADHMGLKGINTLEELARVKQVVVESVSRDGAAVLNADDPLVAEMAAACDGRVIYFSLSPNNHVGVAHRSEGGACVYVENDAIILATGEATVELVELDRIEFTQGGKIKFQVLNALAATAAAWAAGLNPALIARALTTFTTDMDMTPGRFNLTEINGVQVVVDYGHNEGAVKALSQAVQALGERKTFLILTLPGDRKDEDLLGTLRATFSFADSYILHDSEDRRGREENEVPKLLQQHIPADIPCQMVRNEQEAMATVWQQVKPGDRIVIIADLVEETIAMLRERAQHMAEDAACQSPLAEAASDWSGK